MEITVRMTKVYGNEAIYPVDETAKKFAEIAGMKTLTPRILQKIKELGYEIKIEQQKLEI